MRRRAERRAAGNHESLERLAWRLWFAGAALAAAILWITAPGRRETLAALLRALGIGP